MSGLLAGETHPDKLPIVYSHHYNITLMGLEKLHPFDTEKYRNIYQYLLRTNLIKKDQFYVPDMVSEDDLLSVHTRKYLSSLNQRHTVAEIAELSMLAWLPNLVLQRRLLRPMKYATGAPCWGANWLCNTAGR